MKKIAKYLSAAAVLLMSACAKEELALPKEDQVLYGDLITISASMPEEDATKISYDTDKLDFTWDSSDQLELLAFDADGKFINTTYFKLKEGAGKATASFTGNTIVNAASYVAYLQTGQLKFKNNEGFINYTGHRLSKPEDLSEIRNHLLLKSAPVSAEGLETTGLRFKMENSIMRFDFNSVPEDLGDIRAIDWKVNAGTEDEQSVKIIYSGDLKTNGTGKKYLKKVYFCFDPDAMELKTGKRFELFITGSRNLYKLSGVSENGKKYLPDIQYLTTISADADDTEAILKNWEKVEIKAEEGDILVRTETGEAPKVNSTIEKQLLINGPDPENGYWIIRAIDGSPLTTIPARTFKKSNISQIIVPDTVEKIGENCFEGSSLTDVTIGIGLKNLGEYAFASCSKLKSVKFSDGLENIPSHCFWDCTALVEVRMPDTLREISGWAFWRCLELKSIVIPDKVTTIGTEAFTSNISLEEIKISENSQLTTLQEKAFYNAQLTELYLPESMKTMGKSSLEVKDGLTKLTYMSTEPVDSEVFGLTSRASTVLVLDEYWKDNGASGKDWAGKTWKEIQYVKIEKIPEPAPLPEGVKPAADEIWVRSFVKKQPVLNAVQKELSITVSEAINNYGYWVYRFTAPVTEIPAGLFKDVKNVDFIVLPEGVTTIGAEAFMNCKDLKQINLPESITVLQGTSIFRECTALESIIFPSLADIHSDYLLSDCNKLKEITFMTNKIQGENLFLHSENVSGFKYLSKEAPTWSGTSLAGLQTFDIDLTVHVDCSVRPSKNLWFGNTWKSIRCVNDKGETVEPEPDTEEVIYPADDEIWFKMSDDAQPVQVRYMNTYQLLPEKNTYGYYVYKHKDGSPITMLETDFFRDDRIIIEAILPKSCKKIQSRGFGGCNGLKHVTLPEGLTTIEEMAFHWCNSLSSVELPASLELLDGSHIFDNCQVLEKITIPANTKISNTYGMFTNCSKLKEVTFKTSEFDGCRSMFNKNLTLKFLNPVAPDWGSTGINGTQNKDLVLNKACNIQPEGNTWNGVKWNSITLVEVDENLDIIR